MAQLIIGDFLIGFFHRCLLGAVGTSEKINTHIRLKHRSPLTERTRERFLLRKRRGLEVRALALKIRRSRVQTLFPGAGWIRVRARLVYSQLVSLQSIFISSFIVTLTGTEVLNTKTFK